MENSKCWMIFGLLRTNIYGYGGVLQSLELPPTGIIPPVTSTKSPSETPILVINSSLHVILQFVKKFYV